MRSARPLFFLSSAAEGKFLIEPPPGETVPPVRPDKPPPTLRLDVEVTGDITIIINGVPVT